MQMNLAHDECDVCVFCLRKCCAAIIQRSFSICVSRSAILINFSDSWPMQLIVIRFLHQQLTK